MTLEFNINKPGFPVKIGGVELWFDNSYEGLVNFFQAIEEIDKKNEEIANKAKEYEDIDEHSMNHKASKEIIGLKKESVTAFYDNVFGEGSFEKIYSESPNLNELEDLIPVLDAAIGKTITEKEEARAKEVQKRKNQYLNKKKQTK